MTTATDRDPVDVLAEARAAYTQAWVMVVKLRALHRKFDSATTPTHLRLQHADGIRQLRDAEQELLLRDMQMANAMTFLQQQQRKAVA